MDQRQNDRPPFDDIDQRTPVAGDGAPTVDGGSIRCGACISGSSPTFPAGSDAFDALNAHFGEAGRAPTDAVVASLPDVSVNRGGHA